MYSITILSVLLIALSTTTNALQCRPVTCMIACRYGFKVDTEGCPYCSCRKTPSICLKPIAGYTCGGFAHQACPDSYQCQFSSNGITGQCCLSSSDSTTARSVAGSTTDHTRTEATRRAISSTIASTSRMFKRSATSETSTARLAIGSTTGRTNSGTTHQARGSTIASTSRIFKRSATSETSTARLAIGSTTGRTNAGTTHQARDSTIASTSRMFKRSATSETSTARLPIGSTTGRTNPGTTHQARGTTDASTSTQY